MLSAIEENGIIQEIPASFKIFQQGAPIEPAGPFSIRTDSGLLEKIVHTIAIARKELDFSWLSPHLIHLRFDYQG